MKKTLLLQTALVAAAGVMLADASFAQVKAEPLGVTVGGYMTRTFKIQDRDKVAGTAQTDKSAATFGGPDAEIWFSLRAVLDNGLRVGGRVELEGASDGDQIDESYVWFENDMGRIELGSTDRVASKMQYFSPNATLSGQNTGQVSENSAIVAGANQAGGVSMWFANASNDAEGINIYSSSNRYFGSKAGKGLQVGYSYVPDGCEDYNNQGKQFTSAATTTTCDNGFGSTINGTVRNQHTFAANYLESFGDVNLALYAGYISSRAEPTAALAAAPKRVTGWNAGAQVSYNLGGGSTIAVGGGLKREEVSSTVDRNVYVVGVMYLTNGSAPGSIGIGADYWKAKGEEVGQADDTAKLFQVGVSYQLATGIKLYGGAGTYEWEDGAGPNTTGNSKANFGLLGVNLVF